MEKVSLYRKYRPQDFDNLVGQDYIKTTLINAIKQEKVSHAYIFSGPRGTGKTSTARLIAKTLNCEKPKDGHNPCDVCELCIDINEGKLIDLIEIDAASNRGIDEVRDLKEKINFAPTRSKYKVYIIDEVHMMTKEAFNALLKTLEEPPEHAYFILATTEIHKIPETIISRCQRFDFKRITKADIVARLKYIAESEKIEAEQKALELIAKYTDGGMRDAIGLLEQLSSDNKITFTAVKDVLGVSDHSLIEKLYNGLMMKETKDTLGIIQDLHDHGSDLKKFVHEFMDHLREKLLSSIAENKGNETLKIMSMIEVFQDAQEKIHLSAVPQLPLEVAVVRICGPVRGSLKEEIIEEPEVEVTQEEEDKQAPDEAATKEELKEELPVIEEDAPSEQKEYIALQTYALKENWPRITERIKAPSLRMSLKNAVPVDVKEKNVLLQFNTDFHKGKVMEHDHRVELEAVIKELTGNEVKISAEVKKLEIKSVVEEKSEVVPPPGASDAPPVPQKKEKDDVAEALNIFGGEVVE